MTGECVRERITLDVADGSRIDAYLARPAAPGRYAGVVVAHQLFGVTPDIEACADRLAELGYLALAPDFYHRSEAGVALLADDQGRARGLALLGELTRGGVLADVAAARGYVTGRADATGQVAILGLSMGGHLAYLAATHSEFPVALVLYAGWLTGTDIPISRPEPTLALTGSIAGRLVYVVGDEDQLITADERAEIGAALAAAGIDHEVVVLPGVPHAFLSAGTPSYRPEAAARTWQLIGRELAAALG
jgi:carboxymethylenebutenolidase